MEGNRPQFDLLLGGTEELPQDFSLMDFASARAQEIMSISEALQEPRRTGLVFQRLPRHMRRRIMSHNAKRMPRRLREAHMRQMEKGGLPPKPKRPSRKYRRRPSNLLEAYNRRAKVNVWLETHIWHAKRFHMISKWGYKLPHFPNDKSSRACYRGAANHCLLQDVSYFVCIELMGSFAGVLKGLSMLTRQECGLSFQAKMWCNGDREGSIMLFHSDSKYPHGAIGRVSFLWKPLGGPKGSGSSEPMVVGEDDDSLTRESNDNGDGNVKVDDGGGEDSDQTRVLWLWVHPSYYMEVKEELMKVFSFENCRPDSEGEPPLKRLKSEKSSAGFKQRQRKGEKLSEKAKTSEATGDVPELFSGNNVKMKILKDRLVRLRLTGPLSHAVLRETLAIAPQPKDGVPRWLEAWEDVFKQQRELWDRLSVITSPANISPSMILGLAILDPRGNLPPKRTKAVDLDSVCNIDAVKGVGGLPLSPMWDPQIRDTVSSSKPSDAQMNKIRSQNLVPGMTEATDDSSISASDGDEPPRLPILLVQRPGSQDTSRRLGYGSGWDIIAPAGWGKPLWIALVMRGARAAGLRDAEILGEIPVSRQCCWPAPPDTCAGKLEAELMEKEAKQKYFKLPPSKRPNYIHLGISSPFTFPWSILCREWSSTQTLDYITNGKQSQDSFYVLRSTQKLNLIASALQGAQKVWGKTKSSYGSKHLVSGQQLPQCNLVKIITDGDPPVVDDHCLIPVRVTICKKGIVAKHAIICLPIEKDVLNGKGSGQKLELTVLEEPNNPDPFKEERVKARKEHKERLKKLRRKRVKLRRAADEESSDASDDVTKPLMGPKATADICTLHMKHMEELYLPPVVCVRNSCIREVAGFVTSGGFSFSEAREMGYGYVTLAALEALIKTRSWNKKLLVFVRNTSNSHYFTATIEVVLN
ncbi:ribonucleases P/MRP protein subunit POP1 [Ischnura elegans]|uniref:ribonucleases P/MRP protein subunit POP1 n=1 Tax=Ischnura elegans TaxID=197161 RepID=UPI001ED881FB|nr:ribonucleases P/MRP protein subunit POP1 [Ischnura elegans]